MLILLLD
jgi:zinc transporter ZupT